MRTTDELGMPVVTIQISKWLHTSAYPSRDGDLASVLLDEEGRRCCLGFAVDQLDGVPDHYALGKTMPSDCPFVEGAARARYTAPLNTQKWDMGLDAEGYLINVNDRSHEPENHRTLTDAEQRDMIEYAFMGLLNAQVRWVP